MTFRKHKRLTLIILAAAALGSGCITCNVEEKDADSNYVSSRPLSLEETLTPDEKAQADAMSSYAQAVYLRSVGKEEPCRELLLKALAQYPDSETILKELLGPFFVAKDHKGALELMEEILKTIPNSCSCNLVYSELLYAKGDKEKAIFFLQGCFEKSPEERYASQLVKYLLDQNRFGEMDELLARLFKEDKYQNSIKWICLYLRVLTTAYRQFDENGQSAPSEAPDFSDDENNDETEEEEETEEDDSEGATGEAAFMDAFRRKYTKSELKKRIDSLMTLLLKQTITSPEELSDVGGALASQEKWQEMLELLQIIEGQGGKLSKSVPFFKMKLDALDKCGRQEELKRCMEELVSKKELSFSLAGKLSDLFADQNNYPMAIQMMEICLSYDKDNFNIVWRLATLLMSNKEYDKAMLLLSLRQSLPPSGSYLLGLIWKHKGDFKNAYKSMKVAEADKQLLQPSFFFNMSIICEKCGKIDEAVENARKAYDSDPDDVSNCNFYGYLLADHNRELPTALKILQKAVAKEPENAAFLDSLAWVYYRLKEYDKAMEYIFKALEHNGLEEDSEGVIADHAGDICHAKGLHDLARFYWNVSIHSQNSAEDRARIAKKLGN
ncbi:MAG: tetratricopeptide repeat protein [Victivallales bacterium]|nr:tetratricopeptide repeat protein [Victivallales bacterium]